MSLEELCRMRIKEDFGMDVDVQKVKVLKQNEIDKDLNLNAVEVTFRDKDGCHGHAAITLNTWEIHFTTKEPMVPQLPAGAQVMGLLL